MIIVSAEIHQELCWEKGFVLRSVQTHISKQFRIEICVCTLLKANPMGGRVMAYVLKGKINFFFESRAK